jgi:hypothetical protein
MKCKACQRVGMWHCSDVEHCGNMKMMTPAQIKRKLASIKRREEKLSHELAKLQALCPHPNVISKREGSTGNWDRHDDCWWTNYHCPDCSKRWTEDQ